MKKVYTIEDIQTLLLAYMRLKEENARLRAIINIPDVDFPNSEKGGKGVPETPTFFPDDSNLF